MFRNKRVVMSKITDLISDIEIKYFRSIYKAHIKNTGKFCVITGSNDAGKSNILKALNLFFNGFPDSLNNFDFDSNFNYKRKEEIQAQIKTKQFIEIKITFNTCGLYPNTLPNSFWVRKKWFRDGMSQTDDNLDSLITKGALHTDSYKAQRSKNTLLNKIKYTYVPAIKDKETFGAMLKRLQINLLEGTDFANELREVNNSLATQAQELQQDFKKSTNIPIRLALPSKLVDLFQSVRVDTGIASADEFPIILDYRGDGVRVRLIPAILNYIANNSNEHHVWGFEEPENSMEFKRAYELFSKCKDDYSNSAQIFVTSHSPAFIELRERLPIIYFVAQKSGRTMIDKVEKDGVGDLISKSPEILIAEELGHIAILSDMHEKMGTAIINANKAKEIYDNLVMEISKLTKPVVLTEGPTDVQILKEAWKRINVNVDMPFELKSCNVLPEDDSNTAAGANMLQKMLCATLPDEKQIKIGVFDRDKEGEKAFALDNNFKESSSNPGVKFHKNNRAYAFLLPIPQTKEPFAKEQNLPIEFYFEIDILEDSGCVRRKTNKVIDEDGNKVSEQSATEPHQIKVIKEKKSYFAEKVVPNLKDEDFRHFSILFDQIDSILSQSNVAIS